MWKVKVKIWGWIEEGYKRFDVSFDCKSLEEAVEVIEFFRKYDNSSEFAMEYMGEV